MTRYQLTLEAEKLRKASTFRLGRPYAIVTLASGPREGEVLGETEALDTLDPRWSTTIYVETDASIYMPILVQVKDRQDDGKDEALMAEASFEITAVFDSEAHSRCEKTQEGPIIRATVVESRQGSLTGMARLRFRLLDVKNIESGILGLGRTDPFIEVQKKNFDPKAGITRWIVTRRTEHVLDNLNPMFAEFVIPVEALCHGDPLWPLRLELYDWQKGGKHRSMGMLETSLQALMNKIATDGNANRGSALEMVKEGKDTTVALLLVLKAEVDD